MTTISIIIPVYNEAHILRDQLHHLCTLVDDDCEIIVVVAGDDQSGVISRQFNNVKTIQSQKGRAFQMNIGAKQARGQLLFFLHIDSIPSKRFCHLIRQAVSSTKSEAGCFRLQFDDQHPVMQLYGWFSRLPYRICRGGDQGLFITTRLFNHIGGFSADMEVMEDIEIIKRIKKHTLFKILPHTITTSARKYHKNGRIRLQLIFGWIHLLYSVGASQAQLKRTYLRWIK